MGGFNLGDVFVTIKAITEDFQNGLSAAQKKLGGLNDFFGAAVEGSQKFAGGLLAVGTALSVAGGFAVKSASDFQQNRVAFETMLGSADKAQKLLQQVSDFAAETPFELPQVVEGSKKLLAFGVSGDEVIKTFTTLGNIAAGVGTDKLPGLINVFGQVKAAGKLMSQDLLQFTSAGVPVIDLLAQHFGVAKDKVKDMVESGKVKFEDLQASLELLGGKGGKWGDLMAKQSLTFQGTMSNISDQFGRFARNIVGIDSTGNIREGSIFASLTKAATAFLDWLNANGPAIQSTILGIIDVVTKNAPLIAGIIIGGLLPAFGALAVAIWSAMAPLLPFMALGAALVLGFQALKANGIDPVKIAVDIFKAAWDFLGPSLLNLWQVITTQLWPALQQLWQAISPVLIPALQILAMIVGGVIILALRIFIDTLTTVISWISMAISVIATLYSWFSNIVGPIASAFAKILPTIMGALGGVYNAITQPFRDALNWVTGHVESAMKTVKSWLDPFQRHSPSLVERVQKGVLEIQSQYKDMYGALGDIASQGAVAMFAPSLVPSTAGVGGFSSSDLASVSPGSSAAVNVTVDLRDTNIVGTVPRDVAETIGDQVVKKLQQSVRL